MSHHQVEERSWWNRNWGWCLPLSGCLGCVGLVVLLILFAAGSAFMMVRGSEIDELAMEIASSHPAVIEAVGEPVERGLGFQGKIHRSSDGGRVDIRFTIHGPKGRGTLHVKGERHGEEWTLDKLEFRPEGASDWIDLLEGSDAVTAAEDPLSVRASPESAITERRDDQRRRSSR